MLWRLAFPYYVVQVPLAIKAQVWLQRWSYVPRQLCSAMRQQLLVVITRLLSCGVLLAGAYSSSYKQPSSLHRSLHSARHGHTYVRAKPIALPSTVKYYPAWNIPTTRVKYVKTKYISSGNKVVHLHRKPWYTIHTAPVLLSAGLYVKDVTTTTAPINTTAASTTTMVPTTTETPTTTTTITPTTTSAPDNSTDEYKPGTSLFYVPPSAWINSTLSKKQGHQARDNSKSASGGYFYNAPAVSWSSSPSASSSGSGPSSSSGWTKKQKKHKQNTSSSGSSASGSGPSGYSSYKKKKHYKHKQTTSPSSSGSGPSGSSGWQKKKKKYHYKPTSSGSGPSSSGSAPSGYSNWQKKKKHFHHKYKPTATSSGSSASGSGPSGSSAWYKKKKKHHKHHLHTASSAPSSSGSGSGQTSGKLTNFWINKKYFKGLNSKYLPV